MCRTIPLLIFSVISVCSVVQKSCHRIYIKMHSGVAMGQHELVEPGHGLLE